MLAQVLNQALISLSGYPRATAGWVAGGICFVAVTAIGSQLFLRVELGLLVGAAATVAVMGVLLLPRLNQPSGQSRSRGSEIRSAPPMERPTQRSA
jgi:hypothetical protein